MADTCACHHTTCAPHILNDLCMHRRHGSQVSRAEAPLAPERWRKMLRHTPCTDCAATSACCFCRHTLCFGCAAVRARTCCRQVGHAARQVPIALLWPACPVRVASLQRTCLGRHSAEATWLDFRGTGRRVAGVGNVVGAICTRPRRRRQKRAVRAAGVERGSIVRGARRAGRRAGGLRGGGVHLIYLGRPSSSVSYYPYL